LCGDYRRISGREEPNGRKAKTREEREKEEQRSLGAKVDFIHFGSVLFDLLIEAINNKLNISNTHKYTTQIMYGTTFPPPP